MEDFNVWIAIGLFSAYLVVDSLYAIYTISVVERKAFLSANISFTMHLLLAVGVVSYTDNFLYILPLASGSWIGTYLTTKYFRAGSK